MNKKNIVFILFGLVLSFTIVSGAFTFSVPNWQSTQTHSYQNGTGQIRNASEFISDDVKCGGSGTMYDTLTNLCWERAPSTSTFNWSNAVNRCSGLAIAGGNWRLPEKAELLTLLYHNGVSTTSTRLNSVIGFTGIQSNRYWSNTKDSINDADYVSFSFGRSYRDLRTLNRYVLCVKTAP